MLPLLRCVPRALGSAVAGLRAAAPSQPLRQLLQPAPRPGCRLFGLLSVHAGSARGPGLLRARGPCGLGCGALHTEGDKAFAEFLSDEIKEEKKIQKHKSLPKMSGGWELEVNGTEATLVRKVAGEKIYSLCEPQTPAKVIVLSETEEESIILSKGRAYTASLGETAVAFDFGPLAGVPKNIFGQKDKDEVVAYPLYILYENGETFLTYISLLHSPGNLGKLLGPLPMHPAAEDNYGYDACNILCLPCIPNILVIATESGMLYHCVVLEGEEEDDQTSEKSWDSRTDLIPSLYVFECIELELALKLASGEDEPFDSDFACPIKLHRGKIPSVPQGITVLTKLVYIVLDSLGFINFTDFLGQEGLKNQNPTEAEKPASLSLSPPQSPLLTRNLLFGLGGELRGLSGGGEEPSLSQYQRLLCINPPLFEIYQVLLSPTQHHVALIGTKGLMVLELPKRWGKNSEFEGGKSTVNCSTTPIAERFFTSSTSLTVKHAAWYPSEMVDPHTVLLTSDNVISNENSLKLSVMIIAQLNDDTVRH